MVEAAALWIRGGELLIVHLDRSLGKGAEGLTWSKTSRALHLSEDIFPNACHMPQPDTFQAASLPQNRTLNIALIQ
jgi:hypothetical protein